MVQESKKRGIKHYYPKLPLNQKLKAYIVLMRPFTLLAPLFAGIFVTLAPVREITLHHIHYAIYVGVTLALLQACGQVINQYMDAELDKIAKPYRPIPKGLVEREEAMGLAWFIGFFAIARSFTISITFGLFALLLLFFAVFYSLPPFSPRKINPFLNLFWMSFSRGFIPILATFSIFSTIEEAIPYAILAFIITFGWQGSKDVTDVEADLRFGIKTVANHYGVRGLKIIAGVCSTLYTLISVWMWKPAFLILLPLFIYGLLRYEREAFFTENIVGWQVFYSSLAFYTILVFIDYRI